MIKYENGKIIARGKVVSTPFEVLGCTTVVTGNTTLEDCLEENLDGKIVKVTVEPLDLTPEEQISLSVKFTGEQESKIKEFSMKGEVQEIWPEVSGSPADFDKSRQKITVNNPAFSLEDILKKLVGEQVEVKIKVLS